MKKSTVLLESVRQGRNGGKALPLRTEKPTGKYKRYSSHHSRDFQAETAKTA